MNRTLLFALSTLIACANSGYADVEPPLPTQTTEPATKEQDKPALGIDVVGVNLYQGVEITLYDAGNDLPDLQAPIIRNRDAMVRVFVDPIDTFEPRRIRAVLEVEDNNSLEVHEQKVRIEGRSFRGQLDTTFNFEVPGDQIKANTTFKVRLYENNVSEPWGGEEGLTTWDSDKLDAVRSDVVNIVLIPVRYNADGSGRLPDTSESQVNQFRDLMLGMYPAEDVVVTVSQPLDWNQAISPWNVNGWSDLLYTIADMRNNASVDPNTYYYGMFNSEDSFTTFCASGCILGLSNLAWNANDPWYRSSIGIGFTGFQGVSADTFVHEVGHAHGREHADCGGAQGIDPNYPYGPDAIIGSWGYDTVKGFLYDPNENHDVMGYCDPMWVSDYTYYNLYLRIAGIGGVARAAKIPWQTIRVDDSGTASLDKVREFTATLGGDPVEVELLDAVGRVVKVVDGLYSPISHGYGGMVMVDTLDDPAVVGARVPSLEL